ncbi:MAG: hypothetical protein AB1427_09410 [Thermodesulfobacteriota bacterium]
MNIETNTGLSIKNFSVQGDVDPERADRGTAAPGGTPSQEITTADSRGQHRSFVKVGNDPLFTLHRFFKNAVNSYFIMLIAILKSADLIQ